MNSFKIQNLPILSPHNKKEYYLWHNYIEKIYKEPVNKIIDLNKFSWFYWFSPLGKIKVFEAGMEDNVPYGTAWYGKNKGTPEYKYREIGFFVKRKVEPNLSLLSKLEVLRVKARELNCAWFYNTVGSGIFLNLDKLKPIVELQDKQSLYLGKKLPVGDGDKKDFLKENKIKVLIFRHAHSIHLPNSRTEILVYNEGNNCFACILEDYINTGMSGTNKCNCEEKGNKFLNCNNKN